MVDKFSPVVWWARVLFERETWVGLESRIKIRIQYFMGPVTKTIIRGSGQGKSDCGLPKHEAL